MRLDLSKRSRIILFLSFFVYTVFCMLFSSRSLPFFAFGLVVVYGLFFKLWPKKNSKRSLERLKPKRSLRKNNKGIIRILTVFFAGIVCIAFFWWVSYQIFTPFQVSGSARIQAAGTNSTISDAIEIFFDNVNDYIAVLALVGLGYWVLQQSQKRGEPVG